MVDALDIRHPATPAAPGRVSASRIRALLALVMAALALAGCAHAGSPVSDSTRAVAGVAAGGGPFEGLAFPRTVDGASFDTTSLRGRPVVLWFWAPWCAICRGEAPTVTKVAGEYAGRIQFVGVAGQGSVAAMNEFIAQTHAGSFPQLADVNSLVWRKFGVTAQPAFAFISNTGRSSLVVGSMDEQSFQARVAQLAAGQPGTTPSRGRSCTSGASHKPGSLDCGSAGPAHTSGSPSSATMTTR